MSKKPIDLDAAIKALYAKRAPLIDEYWDHHEGYCCYSRYWDASKTASVKSRLDQLSEILKPIDEEIEKLKVQWRAEVGLS